MLRKPQALRASSSSRIWTKATNLDCKLDKGGILSDSKQSRTNTHNTCPASKVHILNIVGMAIVREKKSTVHYNIIMFNISYTSLYPRLQSPSKLHKP